MKPHQTAGMLGILIAFGDILYNIDIVKRLPAAELSSELIVILIKSLFYIAPGIALISKKEIGIKNIWTWSYPLILALGLLNVYTADGPLGSGLPMIVIVFPFFIIFTVIVLVKTKKQMKTPQ